VKITQGLVRVSVGLENYESVLEDILQALDKSK
jgi:cystathionine beta-lyase/cystathionine gamma-synthase